MFIRQEPVQGVFGKEVAVKSSQSDLPKGRVAVIDASQLQPSHIQGQRNTDVSVTASPESVQGRKTTPSNNTTTDTAVNPTDKGGDTARSQNDVLSDDKVTALSSDKQISGEESSSQLTDAKLELMSMDELGQLISDAEYAVADKFDRDIEQLEAEKSALEGKWRRTPAEGRRLKALDKEIAGLEQRKKEEMRAASKRYLDVYRRRLRDKANYKSMQDLKVEASSEENKLE